MAYEDVFRKGFDEYRSYVNPLIAQRAALAGEPVRMVRTRDGRLVDADGQEVEDFHGTQAFGHRQPAIAEAIRRFLESDAPSWYPARVNPLAGRLARMLCERTGYDNVFLGCTGSDAVEASLKLARALTGRPRILGLEGGYHGCTFGSVSLMQRGYLRDPFGPFLEGAGSIPFDDADALSRALEPGDAAAVVVEPIQGEGGVRALGTPFVEALCELSCCGPTGGAGQARIYALPAHGRSRGYTAAPARSPREPQPRATTRRRRNAIKGPAVRARPRGDHRRARGTG